ncbi:MAG: hypothetical protein M1834_005236 [Cirrosporium novae-zelandiae]|nr:MAG: hypothetical protein M1834_005236 [Cirrosporium novae-zelandiae]
MRVRISKRVDEPTLDAPAPGSRDSPLTKLTDFITMSYGDYYPSSYSEQPDNQSGDQYHQQASQSYNNQYTSASASSSAYPQSTWDASRQQSSYQTSNMASNQPSNLWYGGSAQNVGRVQEDSQRLNNSASQYASAGYYPRTSQPQVDTSALGNLAYASTLPTSATSARVQNTTAAGSNQSSQNQGYTQNRILSPTQTAALSNAVGGYANQPRPNSPASTASAALSQTQFRPPRGQSRQSGQQSSPNINTQTSYAGKSSPSSQPVRPSSANSWGQKSNQSGRDTRNFSELGYSNSNTFSGTGQATQPLNILQNPQPQNTKNVYNQSSVPPKPNSVRSQASSQMSEAARNANTSARLAPSSREPYFNSSPVTQRPIGFSDLNRRSSTSSSQFNADSNDRRDSQSSNQFSNAPLTVDPSQVFNPYFHEHEKHKFAAETEERSQSPAIKYPTQPESSSPSHDNEPPTQNQVQPDPGSTNTVMESQPAQEHASSPDPAVSQSEGANMEGEMKKMLERMRELKAKDPSKFLEIWEQMKTTPIPKNQRGPTAAKPANSVTIPSPALSSAIPPRAVSTQSPALQPPSTEQFQPTTEAEDLPDIGKFPASRRKRARKSRGETGIGFENVSTPVQGSSDVPALPSIPKPPLGILPPRQSSSGTRLHPPQVQQPMPRPPSSASRTPQTQPPVPSQVPSQVQLQAPRATSASQTVSPSPQPEISTKRTVWPQDKKVAISEAAVEFLNSIPENSHRECTAELFQNLLDSNPSYIELCETLEGRGLIFNRRDMARRLLDAVPGLNPPSNNNPQTQTVFGPQYQALSNPQYSTSGSSTPAPQQATPSSQGQGVRRSRGRPRRNGSKGVPAPSLPCNLCHVNQRTPSFYTCEPCRLQRRAGYLQLLHKHDHPTDSTSSNTTNPQTHAHPPSIDSYLSPYQPGFPQLLPRNPPLGFQPYAPPTTAAMAMGSGPYFPPMTLMGPLGPPSKESLARKQSFDEIIDLTNGLSDDENEEEDMSALHSNTEKPPVNTFTPTSAQLVPEPSLPNLAQYKLSSSATTDWGRDALRHADVVKPLNKNKAFIRNSYASSTIARDILIAAGRHPRERPLNGHLLKLLNNFRNITYSSDLSTFDWDVVDPGGPKPGFNANEDAYDADAEMTDIHGIDNQLTSSTPQPQSRNLPNLNYFSSDVATRKLISNNKMSTPSNRRGRPPKPTVASSENSAQKPRRRGRPPGAKNKKSNIQVIVPTTSTGGQSNQNLVKRQKKENPGDKFQIYKCRWRECGAELHNLETLRKHVRKLHPKMEEFGGIPCKWEGCGRTIMERTAFYEKPVPVRYDLDFSTEGDFWEHMNSTHLDPLAWKLGDGPSVNQSRALRYQSVDYLSDSSGRQLTPSATDKGPGDSMILPAASMPIRAFNSTHDIKSSQNQAKAVLASIERKKAKTGLGFDRGGCILVTENRRRGLIDDEGLAEETDDDSIVDD